MEERDDIMKKGLILEGGAMRGLFTAGVLDVLMENGVTFDGAVGVSSDRKGIAVQYSVLRR